MSFNLILYIILALSGLEQGVAKVERCLGLALKGGANRGAYEAGAVSSFVNNLPPEEV